MKEAVCESVCAGATLYIALALAIVVTGVNEPGSTPPENVTWAFKPEVPLPP